MASKITAEFDSAALSSAMKQLAQISGRDFETVVRNEGAKVLEAASKSTVKADRSLIEKTKDPELRALRIAAMGLAKRAFYELASAMGLAAIKVPAYVQKATSKNASDSDTSSTTEGSGSKFVLIGSIAGHRSYPGAKMYSAINGAMRKRANYFRKALKEGWLKKAKDIEGRYPWMRAQ
jgi:hypothetical protein